MEVTNENSMFEVDEIQLVYKSKVKPSLRPKVITSRQAADVFRKYWDVDKIEFIEQFKILLVSRTRRVLGMYEVSTGSTADVTCDTKRILVAALKANASGIIIAHNHPAGSLGASEKDILLTNSLRIAGKFVQVDLLDHIIITNESYLSFADRGLL